MENALYADYIASSLSMSFLPPAVTYAGACFDVKKQLFQNQRVFFLTKTQAVFALGTSPLVLIHSPFLPFSSFSSLSRLPSISSSPSLLHPSTDLSHHFNPTPSDLARLSHFHWKTHCALLLHYPTVFYRRQCIHQLLSGAALRR